MRLAVTLRGDHTWRLISVPSLMNEVVTSDDGTTHEFVQLAAPLSKEEVEGWTRGEVSVLSRVDPEEVLECSRTFFPCFVAIADDLETLELPGYTANGVARSHLQLTSSCRSISSRFPVGLERSCQ